MRTCLVFQEVVSCKVVRTPEACALIESHASIGNLNGHSLMHVHCRVRYRTEREGDKGLRVMEKGKDRV